MRRRHRGREVGSREWSRELGCVCRRIPTPSPYSRLPLFVLALFESPRYVSEPMSDDPTLIDSERRRGRGARSNRAGRYESELREAFDDGWESLAELAPLETVVAPRPPGASSPATTAPMSASTSRSTPIAGASTAASTATRGPPTPSSAISPGIDFETRLYAKVNAAELLERELAQSALRAEGDRARRRTPTPTSRSSASIGITRAVLEVLDGVRATRSASSPSRRW